MASVDRLENLDGVEIAALAISRGWEVERTVLFDEEGVEGWRWKKGAVDAYCVADTDTPSLDNPARMYVMRDLRNSTEFEDVTA